MHTIIIQTRQTKENQNYISLVRNCNEEHILKVEPRFPLEETVRVFYIYNTTGKPPEPQLIKRKKKRSLQQARPQTSKPTVIAQTRQSILTTQKEMTTRSLALFELQTISSPSIFSFSHLFPGVSPSVSASMRPTLSVLGHLQFFLVDLLPTCGFLHLKIRPIVNPKQHDG
jgi:hypothetical protein